MKEDNKYPDYFIWLLAGVVILLAVFTADSLVSSKNSWFLSAGPNIQQSSSEINFYFSPNTLNLKQGESKKVDLYLNPSRKIGIAGIDVILNFDPEKVQISQAEIIKVLPMVIANKANLINGQVGWTYLNNKDQKYFFESPVKIVSLTVKGISAGESKINFLTASEKATTVITEDATARKIPFTAGKLKVNIK